MRATPLTLTTDDGLTLAARLHTRDSGDEMSTDTNSEPRPVIVAVHGYPDDSSVWSTLVPHLLPHADVLTYDVRGCGRSDAPAAREGYRLHHLVSDLDLVVRHARGVSEDVHVIAHDWGSIQAWQAVTDAGETSRVSSFTTMSGPCLDHVERWMRSTLHGGACDRLRLAQQLASSSYIAFFRAPHVAEAGIRLGVLPFMLSHTGDGREQSAAGRGAPDERNMRNGLELYRANMLPSAPLAATPRTTDVPTLAVVATGDRYVREPLATCGRAFVPHFRSTRVDAGHWQIVTHAEAVAAAISTHVAAHSTLV